MLCVRGISQRKPSIKKEFGGKSKEDLQLMAWVDRCRFADNISKTTLYQTEMFELILNLSERPTEWIKFETRKGSEAKRYSNRQMRRILMLVCNNNNVAYSARSVSIFRRDYYVFSLHFPFSWIKFSLQKETLH